MLPTEIYTILSLYEEEKTTSNYWDSNIDGYKIFQTVVEF